ncbi:Cysteine desulfurase [Posidoniimonas polymericola]|uniref:cysteine desulfurase n=1 Tax=Posidoniimonas polymericola TaxID=2528002 RepID=A0A5C5YPT6_9BACT|nr:cysteine desulfurase family protein [Posidoniimonas polymericola]TWT76839.1 Cysteine desulfurase [Posidoniimonas polymericola]
MRVYMDNHATTRVDPRVVEAMLPYFTEEYGNPGSVGHEAGDAAREAVEQSRATIAAAIGAMPAEVVFTSGATESNNLAIAGVATRRRRRGDHLVSVATEHAAVLGPLRRLEKQGYGLTLLEVEQHGSQSAGRLRPEDLASALTDETCLASVMLANNEIGVVQPVAELALLCHGRGVPLHCDATQGVGRLPVDVGRLGVDLMSFTAHKLYGPKGIGALYVRGSGSGDRPAVRLEPQIVGGGQQQGRRSGTLNVPGIVGFARAVELAVEELAAEVQRLAALRDDLWRRLEALGLGAELCGPGLDAVDQSGGPLRLPGNLDVTFPGLDGESLLLRLGGLAVSSGAACSSSDPSPSHVLRAIGLNEDQARSSLRFGLGRFNTAGDVEFAAEKVAAAAAELKRLG